MMSIAIVIIVCVAAAIYAAARRVSAAAPIAAAITATPEPTPEPTPEEYAAATAAAKIACDASNKIAEDTMSLYHEFNNKLKEMSANIVDLAHLRLSNRTKNLKVRVAETKATADRAFKTYEDTRRADAKTFAEDAYQRTEYRIERMERSRKELDSFVEYCATLVELKAGQIEYRDLLRSRYMSRVADAKDAANKAKAADRRVRW
jgi:hypothetical protein